MAYFFFPSQRTITQQSFQPSSPSADHSPPSRTLVVTTYSKLLDGGTISASQKYFFPTLVLSDRSWVYTVPGTGRVFSSSARFLSDWLQPTFNSGSEANPQNYLPNCSFWPQECHPVFSEGLSQRLCCSRAGTPVGWVVANHIFLTHPSPGYCWGTLSSHSPISRHWGSGIQGIIMGF